MSSERSRPALQALPGQRRSRHGAEAAARSWWVRPVRRPGGAPVPPSGVSVPPLPPGAPAGGAVPVPVPAPLRHGRGPGKGESPLWAAGALRGLGAPGPVRFVLGSVSGSVSGRRTGSCLCGAGPGVPPDGAGSAAGAGAASEGLPWLCPALSHCEERQNLHPLQPSPVPGKRSLRNLHFLRLPGHIPKAVSRQEKETGFRCLVAGAALFLLWLYWRLLPAQMCCWLLHVDETGGQNF